MTTPRWYMVNKMGMATLCASKADAEKEAADAQRFWPHMGPHRAVQLVEVADVEALRTGYAAARLEIESLRARSPIPPNSGEYPALPEPDTRWRAQFAGYGVSFHSEDQIIGFANERASAAVDADRAQAAPESFLEIPDVQDESGINSHYSRELVLECINAALASHGQAPACAAPDVSGYVSEWAGGICTADEAMAGIAKLYGAQPAPAAVAGPHVTDAMALAFHSALSDGAIGSDEVEEIKAGLRAALAAAPTTQPAPVHADASYESMNLAVMVLSDCGHSSNYKPLLERVAGRIDRHVERLLTAQQADIAMRAQTVPQPSPASQGDALDAARYRLVRRGQHWSVINGIGDALRGEELDAAVDAARKQGANHD